MADHGLPPPPRLRTWKGDHFNLNTIYSAAGLSTSLFLDVPDGRFIVECGDCTVRDMIELERYQRELGGSPPPIDLRNAGEAIKGALITHAHYDHYSGLLTLLNFLQLLGRRSPLPVVYPEGGSAVEALVDHFTDHLWEPPLFEIDLVAMKEGDRVEISGVVVECRGSLHRHSRPGVVGGLLPSLSYRLTAGGESIVFTGDTGDPGPLSDFVEGCDLAVIEATFPEPGFGADGVHLTTDQALELGSMAKDRMLIHFTSGSYEKLLRTGVDPGPINHSGPREGKP
ncbi:MAG: MBL fold metallo-hydrolase [Thermoplasmatota archaeon]